MRLLVLLATALVSVGAGACGGVGKAAGSASRTQSNSTVSGDTPIGTASGASTASTRSYLDDADQDIGGTRENRGYRDTDDSRVLLYGHAASPTERARITSIVKRYYAVAASGDGRTACSMLPPSLVRALPQDYGERGLPYLRGAKTCQAVMERLFAHSHSELSAPVAVTGVLVNHNYAYTLLGSPKMRASYITLHRERGVWTINTLLGNGMP
jgi:hypothetical protein